MRLIINDIEAELESNNIALTRRVIDVDNIAFRYIDVTNRFNLPLTKINKEIFQSAHKLNTDSNYFDRLHSAKIIDEYPYFTGIAILQEFQRGFQVQLADNSKTLLASLNESIRELSTIDNYDFAFSGSEYDNLKLIDSENIWIWCIVNMHIERIQSKTRFASGDAGLKYSRPFFNYLYILKRIFSDENWTLDFDVDLIEKLAISSNAENFFVTSYEKVLSGAYDSGNINDLSTDDFKQGVTVTATQIDIGTTATKFRMRGEVSAAESFTITIKATNTSGDVVPFNFSFDADTTEINIETEEFSTDDLNNYVEITIDKTITFTNCRLYSLISETNFADLSTNPLLNYRVKAYDNLPDISKIDLFRNALLMTNSIIVSDSFTKTITCKSLNKLSKIRSVDWSQKFEEKSELIKNIIQRTAQKNYLKYDNDDTISENTGRFFFNVDNQALEKETEYLNLIFSASSDVTINSSKIADLAIYNDTERENDLNNRIVYVENDATNTYTTGRFTDISFENLYLNYYKKWFENFKNPRIVEGVANLKKIDVIGHDFLDLVYIDYFGSCFFVLSIEDYVPGLFTKVILLKYD